MNEENKKGTEEGSTCGRGKYMWESEVHTYVDKNIAIMYTNYRVLNTKSHCVAGIC